MSKRLAFLEKLTAGGSDDPMAWYGLAMEYRTLGRVDEALKTFEALRAKTPDYVAMYLMCGEMLKDKGDTESARAWLTAGVATATQKRDTHALGELETALGSLDAPS
jgi:predicted Zn-dependent protease